MFQRIRYIIREFNWMAIASALLGVATIISPFVTHYNLAITAGLGLAGIVAGILSKNS